MVLVCDSWTATPATRVLAGLIRFGWRIHRQIGWHCILVRDGYLPVTFAFHEGETLGPVMLARLSRDTGLRPPDQELSRPS